MKRAFWLYAILSSSIIALWVVLLARDRNFGVDFYPLYFAGERVRSGFSPYGTEATAALMREWTAPFASAGIAYPLPFILLVVPLTLLPFTLAVGIWILVGLTGIAASFRLSALPQSAFLIALLYLPFYRSVSLGQATLLWVALAALLVPAIQSRSAWAVGLISALLLLKPQNGLLFAMAGLVWGAAVQRQVLWWFAGVSALLWGSVTLLQPNWLSDWVAQLQVYRDIVHPPRILPGGLLLVIACWRLPWWARVAAAQVVLFPLSDLYSALPLLLCWVSIGGPLAVIGVSISWLWSLWGLPNTITVFWWLLIWPLILSSVWHSWIYPRILAKRHTSPELSS